MTTHYAFSGRLTKELTGDDEPVSAEEAEAIIDHLLYALSVYERRGFRFVDVDASVTSDATLRIEWSDHDLVGSKET